MKLSGRRIKIRIKGTHGGTNNEGTREGRIFIRAAKLSRDNGANGKS